MSSRIYQAIVSRWDAQSLDTDFPGGIFFSRHPTGSGKSWPYVVFYSLGNFPKGFTSSSEFRTQTIQFSIFYKEDNATDPVLSVGALMRTLDTAFMEAPLSVASGEVLSFRRTRDDLFADPEAEGVWVGQIDYTGLRRVAYDCDGA